MATRKIKINTNLNLPNGSDTTYPDMLGISDEQFTNDLGQIENMIHKFFAKGNTNVVEIANHILSTCTEEQLYILLVDKILGTIHEEYKASHVLVPNNQTKH